MTRTVASALVGTLLLAIATSLRPAESGRLETLSVEAVVQQLRTLPSPLPGAQSMAAPTLFQTESLRRELYSRLLALYPASVPALAHGLDDPDVAQRRSVLLALQALGGGWWRFDGETHKVDISAATPALMAALGDSDSLVRSWAAQSLGDIGLGAVVAVPALIDLLENGDEGSRNSACIAFRGIGPAARSAMPALRKALSDPSKDVRKFAADAIKSIEGQ